MQERRHVGRGARLRRRLHPAIDVRREHHRRSSRGRVEVGERILALQQAAQMRDAEVNLAAVVRVFVEPIPSVGERLAVYRIVVVPLGLGLVGTNENRSAGIDAPAHAVQAAEALAQGVEARAFGDEPVEVEVGADLQSLGGDDDDRLLQRASVGAAGMKVQFLQPPYYGVFVHRSHATGEQDGQDALVVFQPPMRLARGRHSIGEDDDGPPLVAQKIQRTLRQRFRQLARRLATPRLRYSLQRGRFVSQLPPAELVIRVVPLVGLVPEDVLQARWRRRRHHNRTETALQRFVRPPGSLEETDGLQGLEKRLRAMRLVEQDEAVVGGEPRVDGPSPGAAAVGPEQQARADLVDGRCDDGRLQGVAGPGFGAVHATAQCVYRQRVLLFETGRRAVGNPSEIVRNRLQNALVRLVQLLRQTPGTLVRLVDDDAPINGEEDATRSGDRPTRVQPRRLSSQGEHGDIHARGLAGRGRQRDGVRPGRFSSPARRFRSILRTLQHPASKRLLPGKRVLAPQRVEELLEIAAELGR